MPVYRVSMVLAENEKHDPATFIEHITKFAGCSSEEDARRKARSIYAPRVVSIKWAKQVQE